MFAARRLSPWIDGEWNFTSSSRPSHMGKRRGRSRGLFVVSSDGRQRPNDLLDRDLEAGDDAGVAASRE